MKDSIKKRTVLAVAKNVFGNGAPLLARLQTGLRRPGSSGYDIRPIVLLPTARARRKDDDITTYSTSTYSSNPVGIPLYRACFESEFSDSRWQSRSSDAQVCFDHHDKPSADKKGV